MQLLSPLDQENKTIEESLNIEDENDRVQFLLKIFVQILTNGGQLTKKMFVPKKIFESQIKLIQKYEDRYVHVGKQMIENIKQYLLNKDFEQFKQLQLNMYKEYIKPKILLKQQKVIDHNHKNQDSSYKQIFKNTLKTIYVSSFYQNTAQNFRQVFIDLLQTILKLMETINDEIEDIYFKEENLLFLIAYIKDVVCKLVLNAIEIRMIQYQKQIKNQIQPY